MVCLHGVGLIGERIEYPHGCREGMGSSYCECAEALDGASPVLFWF